MQLQVAPTYLWKLLKMFSITKSIMTVPAVGINSFESDYSPVVWQTEIHVLEELDAYIFTAESELKVEFAYFFYTLYINVVAFKNNIILA